MTLTSMRTYFGRPGNAPVDTVTFAVGVFGNIQRAVRDQMNRIGFATQESIALLDVVLGDPAQPADRPLDAYVNHGEWKAKCECGGCEYVDMERPLFMCCSCWNAADAHAWRTVVIPVDFADIEGVLEARAEENQHWYPSETVADLEAENTLHGLPLRAEEIAP